ncbi:Uncharacterised protein [Mycobacteroides abscessus subsp. abscessus]|nr:Uncharacterised protein [Mycobacteroides abscessus subsp. abscessus]
MSERSTSGMSWLKASAPARPMAAATSVACLVRFAATAVTSRKANTPAAASSTVRVGTSRNDSRVVLARVASMDSNDHRYTDVTPMASAPARTELRARATSHTVPIKHRPPSMVGCSMGKDSSAPSLGR